MQAVEGALLDEVLSPFGSILSISQCSSWPTSDRRSSLMAARTMRKASTWSFLRVLPVARRRAREASLAGTSTTLSGGNQAQGYGAPQPSGTFHRPAALRKTLAPTYKRAQTGSVGGENSVLKRGGHPDLWGVGTQHTSFESLRTCVLYGGSQAWNKPALSAHNGGRNLVSEPCRRPRSLAAAGHRTPAQS
jgi:hypothetical protein